MLLCVEGLRKIVPARRTAEDSTLVRQGEYNNAGAILRKSSVYKNITGELDEYH